jgi:hypothetical protein
VSVATADVGENEEAWPKATSSSGAAESRRGRSSWERGTNRDFISKWG